MRRLFTHLVICCCLTALASVSFTESTTAAGNSRWGRSIVPIPERTAPLLGARQSVEPSPLPAGPAAESRGSRPFDPSATAGRTSPNVISAVAAPGSMLYAPAFADDPAYRAAISGLIGGPVDYFDARAGTPTAALLAGYDCVYTHTGNQYLDRVLMGDRLADFVDAGGKVILGIGCTAYNIAGSDFSLGGRIMTAAYCPVKSPTGNIHVAASPYIGDGTSCLHRSVAAYDCVDRDMLAVQGSGIIDGHYTDGEISGAYRPDGRVVYTNGTGATGGFGGTGDWPRLVANACECPKIDGPRMLCAWADADDPTYRAAISAITGGAVDYFDASAGTPTAAQLATYDCVYTHPNVVYADRVTLGNRLADFVDAGGKVILGVFCAIPESQFPGFPLQGRIMTAGYSPVVASANTILGASSAYRGDGTTCLHFGVTAYDNNFRDVLVTQGSGQVDGHYLDSNIAHAYRPDGRVVYSNGFGAVTFGATGDWPRLIANACQCSPPGGTLWGCTNDAQLFRLNLTTGAGSFVGTMPTFPTPGSTEIEYDETTGRAYLQTRDGAFSIQAFGIATGVAGGPLVGDAASFNGMEFVNGRLYATGIAGGCGPSTLRVLDPVTGASTTIGVTGVGPIVGLAYDNKRGIMYGATSGCSGPSNIVSVDLLTGVATPLGNTGTRLGSLEFGPDGSLYGGGDRTEGGNLYRINPTTGFSTLIGPTGYLDVTGLTYAPNRALAVGDRSLNTGLALAPPNPNPSGNGVVQFAFTLPTAGNATLELFDLGGRRVWRKETATLTAGAHRLIWDGRESSGRVAAPGIYLVKLTTPMGSRTARLARLQ